MEEALITQIIVADGIEPFKINQENVDTPIELQLRMEEKEWDTIDLYLNGKLLFRADWAGNLMPFFKRALEMWPDEN